jgi:hypothetical protein
MFSTFSRLALGRLLPDPDIFLYAYVRREGVLSSQRYRGRSDFFKAHYANSLFNVCDLNGDMIGHAANL